MSYGYKKKDMETGGGETIQASREDATSLRDVGALGAPDHGVGGKTIN